MSNPSPEDFDVVVIGGGAAGLHVSLEAAQKDLSVCLISRKPLAESSSYWAQGGLAAAIGPGDSPDRHAQDTIAAGRGACRAEAARILAQEAPAAVEALQRRGVEFDTDTDGGLALALEGGHSQRRIVHSGGSETGRRIVSRLAALVATEPLIEAREGASAVALLAGDGRAAGVIIDDAAHPERAKRAERVTARATILTTGGAAARWSRTTNPWGAIGAGPVLAHAAGADLADLELCQFHPTALAKPGTPHDGLLITEAIRGEGARLLDSRGERFTDELAPRDTVCTAILEQMDAQGAGSAWLDLREIDAASFPNVFSALREAGIEPSRELVPVAPAAHYVMGGIVTDLDGRTSIAGLYAVGECACSGLHGANRLASNSLTECFVFGTRAATAAALDVLTGRESHGRLPRPVILSELDASEGPHPPPPPDYRFQPPAVQTREAVWRCAGPRRTAAGLKELLGDPYPLARMIAAAALRRTESRGGHMRLDFPEQDPAFDGGHLVHRDGEIELARW